MGQGAANGLRGATGAAGGDDDRGEPGNASVVRLEGGAVPPPGPVAHPLPHHRVYRNSILALPWYTSVRVKLEDPAYAGWFLNFSNPPPHIKQQGNANTTCDNTFSPPKCSTLFHDSVQTPGYPSGDGDCAPPGCDVGKLPIGAYLFNPGAANTNVNGQTFAQWFVDDYLFGPYGGGNPNVSGFFFDDQMNPNGATESKGTLANLGLTAEQGAELSEAYWALMNHVYAEVIARGKFSWQLLWTGQKQCAYKDSYSCLGSTGPKPIVTRKNCAAALRSLCAADSPAQTRALMYPLSGQPESIPDLAQDLANFLLVRGPNAFLGHAWKGCSHRYVFPPELNLDYGEPTELCAETAPNSGVFKREWSKATVEMDCNAWKGAIKMRK